MIYHDLTFETLAKAPVKSSYVEVARQGYDPYSNYDNGLTWTSATLLMSVNIDAVGHFLGTATKKATVKLLGIVSTAVKGDMFQIRLGLRTSDPSVPGIDTISEGFYFVDDIAFDYEAGSTTITMYDHMWVASQTPYPATFSYPTTVQALAMQVASKLQLSLGAGFSSLPNASYAVSSDLYATISNASLQTVIQEIASTTGTSARISDRTLVFSKFTVNSENLTSTELKKLKIGNKYGPVTSVILGRVPQNDNVAILNKTSTSPTVTGVNTTTNLLTINANGMTNGTMVRIASTATLPAPLVANTNYFVYNAGSANTFALTTTYANAIAGTSLIDLTTAGTGTITLTTLTLQEVQINNVQIVDGDRATALTPLYASLLGTEWNESTAETVGLAWHEVGDVIQYTQDANTVASFLSEVHLTLAGSVKESLVSVIPSAETINYQTAGGVLKTLYNTEIRVDKQDGIISSIVESQGENDANFTRIDQDIDNIQVSIQDGGGINGIKNSVGYSVGSGSRLNFWTYSGTTKTNVATNPSFEDLSTTGWVARVGAGPTPSNINIAPTPASGFAGVRALSSISSGAAGTAAMAIHQLSGLTIGATYEAYAYVRRVSTVGETLILGYSTNGTSDVTTTSLVVASGDIGWKLLHLTFVPTVTNPYIRVSGPSQFNLRGLYLDGIAVGIGLTGFFDGNTTDTTTDIYSWTGTPNLSTSTWSHYPSIVPSPDTGSLVAGAASQNRIDFSGGAGYITQRVIVQPGAAYSLSFYAKKEAAGVATVSLTNDVDSFSIPLATSTVYDWQEFTIENIVSTSSYFDVKIEIDASVTLFSITDLMLARGALAIAWQQAAGEVANTSVSFDTTGIKVSSSVYNGAYTQITPLEFAGYDTTGARAFALNNDTTEVNKLKVSGDITTPYHKIIFLSTGPYAGMNFVVKT